MGYVPPMLRTRPATSLAQPTASRTRLRGPGENFLHPIAPNVAVPLVDLDLDRLFEVSVPVLNLRPAGKNRSLLKN
jgi:hypothetical protein